MKLAKRSVVMLVFALLCMLQVATAQSTKLEAPYSHPLNLVMQDIMNYVSYGLTVVLLLAAARLGARQRTPFYVLIVLASMVAAFGEPIYDVCMMLWFYAPGMVSLFTAFGIPQPIWAHSGYAVLYAFPALCICNQIYKGTMTRSKLFAWAGAELFMSCVFEMLGINFGTYCYWGPHVFRIFNYPIIIAILEAAQTICFSVAAANLRQRVHSSSGLLALFVLFPLTMIGINGGAGMPMIVAIHLEHATPMLVAIGTLISVVFALVAIRFAAAMLPTGIAEGQSGGRAAGSRQEGEAVCPVGRK